MMPIGADGNPGEGESSGRLDFSNAVKRQVEHHGKNDPILKHYKLKLKIRVMS